MCDKRVVAVEKVERMADERKSHGSLAVTQVMKPSRGPALHVGLWLWCWSILDEHLAHRELAARV